MRTLPKSIRRPDWSETGIPKAERRLNRSKIVILDAKGQEAMRKVCRLAREVLDIAAAHYGSRGPAGHYHRLPGRGLSQGVRRTGCKCHLYFDDLYQ